MVLAHAARDARPAVGDVEIEIGAVPGIEAAVGQARGDLREVRRIAELLGIKLLNLGL
jgi:gamma-glutamylcysteine synthetase